MKHFRILIPVAALLLLFFPAWILQATGWFLVLVITVSWLISKRTRHGLEILTHRPVVRCFLHEKHIVHLTLKNNSLLPLSMVVVKDETGGLNAGEGQAGVFHLPPRSQVEFIYDIWSSRRGLYRLGPLRVGSSDPLGFFPWEIAWNCERLVFVYPTISELLFTSNHGLSGGPLRSHNPVHLDTTQIRSVRPYEAGDDPRFMHWPASARAGSLQIKEFLRNLVVPFHVVLNLDEADYVNRRKSYHLERCVEAAAAFVNLAAQRGFALGFTTNGRLPPESLSALHLQDYAQDILSFPINPAAGAASFILSSLSVIGFGSAPLAIAIDKLRFHLKPRILIISPPLAADSYHAICGLVPRSCQLDFWFLDEHVGREDRIGHQDAPNLPAVHLHKLPEYGSDLLNEEATHG
jgi:uncharacterized protein (DUF58 family)